MLGSLCLAETRTLHDYTIQWTNHHKGMLQGPNNMLVYDTVARISIPNGMENLIKATVTQHPRRFL